MRSNARYALFCTTLLGCTAAAPALAQNGYSFTGSPATVDLSAVAAAPSMACADFAYRTTYDFTIFSAELVPASDTVPEHCRLDGLIRPEIRFQVNLPTAWNGRFYMHGNGGYAGTQPGDGSRGGARDAAVAAGFAAAYTDTGHDASVFPLGTFAYRDLAAEVDYTYRSIYLTAITAQDLVAEYYGQADSYSYWDGCSTGGRQGLVFAQRFPEVFDGIVAGAPVLNFTDIMIEFVWNTLAIESAEPLSDGQLATMAELVYGQCDALDGAEDGLIRDPRQCEFHPAADLPVCDGAVTDSCLSQAQVDAVSRIYGGTMSQGEIYFPGQPVSAEAADAGGNSGWDFWLVSDGPSRQALYGQSFMENMAFIPDDPEIDWRQFDFDADPARITTIRQLLDTTNPDLSAFHAAGGRMVTYFGWADTALNPLMGIGYYEDVMATMGETAADTYRFFTVPGMFHCRGGVGPDRIDAMSALIDWVEGGQAPERMVAESGSGDDSQLLCPYPQQAVYSGSGDPLDAANWTCGE